MSEELYYIDIPYYSNISRGGMFKLFNSRGGKFYRASVKRMRHQLLEPPPDLFGLEENEKEDHVHSD